MLTHKQVWNAIDVIAERYGYSASGLAKKSGLDPTSFNPSKRNGPDGRPRWPTMESVSRLLQASGAGIDEFGIEDVPFGQRLEQADEQRGVAVGPDREVQVGLIGGIGASGIDEDDPHLRPK